MATIRVTTDLPISAECAYELVQTAELFKFVIRPVLRVTGLPDSAGQFTPGDEIEGRLWWFGVIPSWKHRLRLLRIEPFVVETAEGGGPVKKWNHRLTFEPLTDNSCRYTDHVEIEAGLMTPSVWLFAATFYRYRQARWRSLARVLGAPAVASAETADTAPRAVT